MAGAGKKTFTAGEVLTASDVNGYLMEQSVMVFAGTAARSSAIPTPSDGMLTYNQSNNALEAYNGSEWINKSGLQLVKKQTIGSAVTSVTVTNAFSATYENYKIIVGGGVASQTSDIALKLGSTTANYYGVLSYGVYTNTTPLQVSTNNGSSWAYVGACGTASATCNFDILSPQLARETRFNGTFNGPLSLGSFSAFQASATQFTDFTLTPAAGTLTGGTIYVYGYGT